LLGLSNLFKKSQPIPTGILSGLGEGLAKDDYADRDEWFKFEKKHDDTLAPETTTTTTSTDTDLSQTSLMIMPRQDKMIMIKVPLRERKSHHQRIKMKRNNKVSAYFLNY
jgi:hypothetical protein